VSPLNVTGNVTSGNINSGGVVSAAGNVSGGNLNVTSGLLVLAQFPAGPSGAPNGALIYNTSLQRIQGFVNGFWTNL
jgi:hypothetical protein